MYPGQNISRETNQFLKETSNNIWGAVFLVYRDTPLLARFRMVEPSYLPIKGYLYIKFGINVAKNVQMHPIHVLYRETRSVGGKESRKCIS